MYVFYNHECTESLFYDFRVFFVNLFNLKKLAIKINFYIKIDFNGQLNCNKE